MKTLKDMKEELSLKAENERLKRANDHHAKTIKEAADAYGPVLQELTTLKAQLEGIRKVVDEFNSDRHFPACSMDEIISLLKGSNETM